MSDALRVTKVIIKEFRHLQQPATLRFGAGPIVLLGRNGTGKTNLLLLLDSIVSGNFVRFANDPGRMDVSWTLEHGDQSLTCRVQRGDGTDLARKAKWTAYVDHAGVRRQLRPPAASFLEPMFWAWSSGPRPPTPTVTVWPDPFDVRRAGRLDEHLGAFRALTEGVHDPDGIPVWSTTAPLWSTTAAVDLGAHAAAACGFARLEIIPAERGPAADVWGTTHGGRRIPGWDFSLGQKRIVAFFWHLFAGLGGAPERRAVLLADDLLSGIHHEAAEAMVDAIHFAKLQTFLATQNPLLLDHLAFGDDTPFQDNVVLCFADQGWVWRNPTPAESRGFRAGAEVGFQHTSEILRERRLW